MDEAYPWDRPVFTAGSRKLTIHDVLRAAHFLGELDLAWTEVCRLAARGDFEVDEDAVQAASEEFRSERDLITAEETEQWLDQRGLTLEEFGDYFVRHQGEETLDPGDGHPAMTYADAPEEMHDLLRIDLLISGEFDRLSERLAWRFAARDAGQNAPASPPLDWLEELREVEAAYHKQSALVLDDRSREDGLQALRLPLTRLEIEILELESADAAHEALLCLREDGESMADVARDGRYPLRSREVRVDEVAEEVRSPLLSASIGEVLGPFSHGDEFLIYRLLRKIEPQLVDEAVAVLVDQYVVERHFTELAAKYIHWIIAPIDPYASAPR